MMTKTYVWCKVQKKLVEKGCEEKSASPSLLIIPPLKPFISPITGEEITGREQLRRHNREHGVTNSADYSPEFLAQRRKERIARTHGQTRKDRAERISLIRQQLDRS